MPLAFTTGTSSHPKNTLQKRKFEFKVLLLLHILIPGVMLSSLETINPWLSACDLKQQSPSDLKGSCSATQFPTRTTPPPDVELLCPKECPPNESKTNDSCLAYLDDARRSAICNFNLGNGIEWLKSFLGTIRLRHCCEYKIIESLSQSLLERVLRGKDECFRIIDSLVDVDNLAARVTCEFSGILSRYDCEQPYSVKFSCNDCLEAYRRWVCSTLVPYFNESTRIRPCRSVCQSVEQKCPYFLPENKAPALPTQYAGEPTFLCMDPNIPETGEQQKRSLYPDKNTCCVKICGSLKDGLCVEKGSNCKSEDLIAYEEALDQTTECGASESLGTRVPSLECTASEPYSSPHKLGSGASRVLSAPALVLTAYLNYYSQVRRTRYLIIFLVLHYYLYAFPLLKILACLFVAFADFTRINSILSLTRFKPETRMIFHLIKHSKLIFNYFKFNSNRWQYYFILISVNLMSSSFVKNLEPLMTPPCLRLNGFPLGKGETTRRARRYNTNNYYNYYYYHYYFYYNCNYYYYYKHYYTILRRIAQNSNELTLNSRKLLDSTRIPVDLVIIIIITIIITKRKNRYEIIYIRLSMRNDISLTKSRIKLYSDVLITIITAAFGERQINRMKIAEASFFVSTGRVRRRTEEEGGEGTDEDDDGVKYNGGSVIFIASETSPVLWQDPASRRCSVRKHNLNESETRERRRGRRRRSRRRRRRGRKRSELKLNSFPVKLCYLPGLQCSDPKCKFQTFINLNLTEKSLGSRAYTQTHCTQKQPVVAQDHYHTLCTGQRNNKNTQILEENMYTNK